MARITCLWYHGVYCVSRCFEVKMAQILHLKVSLLFLVPIQRNLSLVILF